MSPRRALPALVLAALGLGTAGCALPDFLGPEGRWFGPSGRNGFYKRGDPAEGVDPTPRGVIHPSISQSEIFFAFGHWPTDELRRSRENEQRAERERGIHHAYPDPRFRYGDGDDRLRFRIGPTVGLGLDRRHDDEQAQEGGWSLPVAMFTSAVLLELPVHRYMDRARLELQIGYAQGFNATEQNFEMTETAAYAWFGLHIPW